MKDFTLAALAALIVSTSGAVAADSPKTNLSGPFTHKNLDVYLIHGADKLKGVPILTLGEAIEQKKVIVHETGDVGELKIENLSKTEHVYIHSGDIVKGGKQDRTLPNGFLVAPLTKPVPLESFCVEQGRWANRGKESIAAFNASANALSSNGQKLAAKVSKSQSAVWQEVAVAQGKLSGNLNTSVQSGDSASSLQLTLENKKLKEVNQAYRAAINAKAAPAGKADVVGFAFAINGKFTSSDAFTSRELFLKMWPKLLEAASTEAIAEAEEGKKFSSPTKEKVHAAIVAAEAGKKLPLQKFAGGNQLDTRYVKEAMYFETAAPIKVAGETGKPTAVHFNVLTKDPDFDPSKVQIIQGNNLNINGNRLNRQRGAQQIEMQEPAPQSNAAPAEAPEEEPEKKRTGLLERLFGR